ncbi:MAG: hypothetical protein OXN89_11050 [Bryobacterales bacterium]|nr:hypothetical protein [Bryobacterales bacterium]
MASTETLPRITSFQPDYPSAAHVTGRRGADRRLRLHQQVLEEIGERPRISKRLSIVVQQMAALGRSTIVKGCSGHANRGWRRTPLGGHHGMHYYLWWSPQGTRQTRKFASLERDSILLRAVRHHDDHRPLNVGRLMDYHTLEWQDLDGDSASCFQPPWTDVQELFALEDRPVRMVYGYPGSGKTVALWKAVEARTAGRTIYLSWSPALIRQARARFSAFAPPGAAVDARDFSTFLGELCGTDVRRQSLTASRAEFKHAFEWWKISDHLGPWKKRMDALHAELRAVLFGCAVPGMFNCSANGFRLSDEAYLSAGASSVGRDAGVQVLESIRRAGWRTWYDHVFPEIAAAKTAMERLRRGFLPDGLVDFDRIVVDELQDLTLLESAVIAEYCRALAAKRGRAPWLLMAFDDGQTVRPSGFHAGRLNSLLHDWLTVPEEFNLERNVRSPGAIAGVVERASILYTVIRKRSRPVDQRRQLADRDGAARVDSRIIYTELDDRTQAQRLLVRLGEVDDVAVVTPEGVVPDWVPKESRDAILTPEDAKGLEYASVCVLDLAPVLKALRRSVDEQDPLEIHQRRTAIDRLRVALSRATENLILVDVAPDDLGRELCLQLLGSAERFTASDLLELFDDADAPPDERVYTRTGDAKALMEVNLRRAWQRALQALRLLGGTRDSVLVDDEAVQSEVCLTVLAVAARRLTEDELEAEQRNDIGETARKVAVKWGNSRQATAVRELVSWTREPADSPLDLLECGLELGEPDRAWFEDALAPVHQALRKALRRSAADPSFAPRIARKIDGCLRLAGVMGEVGKEVERLRGIAAEALAREAKFPAASKMLSLVKEPDPRTVGMIAEGLGRYAQAATAFEDAALREAALRNWRLAGNFEKALSLADGQTKEDLQWLIATEKHMSVRPFELQERISPSERSRLTKATRMPARTKPVQKGAKPRR